MRKTFFIALLSASLFPQAFAQVGFRHIGDLRGGETRSGAGGISANAGVVSGTSASSNGQEAYRWTRENGIQGLGDLPGGIFESACGGMSADGKVITGYGMSTGGQQAFRWTPGTGMVGLGDLPGGAFYSAGYQVSANGSVIVGQSEGTAGLQAFRWTQATGMVGLGDLPGGAFWSKAVAVSADGNAVTGWSANSLGFVAYKWTSGTGMVSLGDLPGGIVKSFGLGISGDGSTVVGQSWSAAGIEAFRWTSGTGMVNLGDLPGGPVEAYASDVSGDGSIVVGYGTTAAGQRAFIWKQSAGMVELSTYLANAGVAVPAGWTLLEAVSITDDGNAIVGYGTNPQGKREGWLVVLPTTQFDAMYLSQTPPPASMVAGETAPVSITMRNLSNVAWSPEAMFKMGTKNPINNFYWGFNRIPMNPGDWCPPGSDYTFSRTITAPWAPGSYRFQWRAIQSGVVWFGDLTAPFTVTVTRAPNAAVFVSQSVPTTVTAGSTFDASITMRNTGTNTWTTADNYRLGSTSPANNVTWGFNRVELPASASVGTDEEVTFTATCTAPATPGKYSFQWRMIKSGVAFFGEVSAPVTVQVA